MSLQQHVRPLPDTSCLLKLFFPEAETQMRARLLGGLLTRSRHRKLMTELERMLKSEPFNFSPFPSDGVERARRMASNLKVHARTLDLLHLAAMDALGIGRLFTNDHGQAAAARALGVAVLQPAVGVSTSSA